mgnify:FL=1
MCASAFAAGAPLLTKDAIMVELLTFTEATEELVNELVDIHGDLVFHQSGGCCDGSAPMCFPRD